MRAGVALLVALSALLPASGAAGPIQVDATVEQYFRLQWQATPGARGAEIAGSVENVSDLPVDRMRLLVEHLDAGGAVVGASTTWVMGIVVPPPSHLLLHPRPRRPQLPRPRPHLRLVELSGLGSEAHWARPSPRGRAYALKG